MPPRHSATPMHAFSIMPGGHNFIFWLFSLCTRYVFLQAYPRICTALRSRIAFTEGPSGLYAFVRIKLRVCAFNQPLFTTVHPHHTRPCIWSLTRIPSLWVLLGSCRWTRGCLELADHALSIGFIQQCVQDCVRSTRLCTECVISACIHVARST